MRPWVKHTIGVTVTSVVIFVAALLMATVSVLSVREHSITDGHAGPMQFLAALLEVPFVVLTFPTTLSPPGTWLDSTPGHVVVFAAWGGIAYGTILILRRTIWSRTSG